jgi:hypothetical protein
MGFFLPGAFGLVLGVVVALLLASSARRVVILLVVGVVLAAVYFGFVWLVSPASADEAGNSCSDCGQWLGRFWEGGLVLFLLSFDLVGWWAGVLAGAALRRRVRPARTRPA